MVNIQNYLPRMAITTSSFKISIEPRAIKYSDVNTSPLCTNVSPGGACVVLNFNDNALQRKNVHKENRKNESIYN